MIAMTDPLTLAGGFGLAVGIAAWAWLSFSRFDARQPVVAEVRDDE